MRGKRVVSNWPPTRPATSWQRRLLLVSWSSQSENFCSMITPGGDPESAEKISPVFCAISEPMRAGSLRVMPVQRHTLPVPKTMAKSPGPEAAPKVDGVAWLTLSAHPALSIGAVPANSSSFPATVWV